MKLGSRIGCISLYAFVTFSGVFVGVLVIRGSLKTRANDATFDRSGVTILGTVTDHVRWSGDIHRNEKDSYFVVASYQVAGRSYTVQADYGIARTESQPVGSTVQVRYLPSDPGNARIIGLAEQRWLVPALFGAAVLIVSSCALALVIWLGYRVRRTRGAT
jgi:hypothetical protein